MLAVPPTTAKRGGYFVATLKRCHAIKRCPTLNLSYIFPVNMSRLPLAKDKSFYFEQDITCTYSHTLAPYCSVLLLVPLGLRHITSERKHPDCRGSAALASVGPGHPPRTKEDAPIMTAWKQIEDRFQRAELGFWNPVASEGIGYWSQSQFCLNTLNTSSAKKKSFIKLPLL